MVAAPNPQAPAAAVTNNFEVNLANSLPNIAAYVLSYGVLKNGRKRHTGI